MLCIHIIVEVEWMACLFLHNAALHITFPVCVCVRIYHTNTNWTSFFFFFLYFACSSFRIQPEALLLRESFLTDLRLVADDDDTVEYLLVRQRAAASRSSFFCSLIFSHFLRGYRRSVGRASPSSTSSYVNLLTHNHQQQGIRN
jgi:hypothetical protein